MAPRWGTQLYQLFLPRACLPHVILMMDYLQRHQLAEDAYAPHEDDPGEPY